MNFHTSSLVVLHLMTTLCAITLSEAIFMSCPDTARRELKDISNIYNCTPYFIPEEEVAICHGVVSLEEIVTIARVTLTFNMLEEVPEGTAMCLGLRNLFVTILEMDSIEMDSVHYYTSDWYSFDFNPLLAVGILTADDNTSKTNRSCSISLLSDVLNLNIFSPGDSCDFSAPLLGTQFNWIQNVSMSGNLPYTRIYLSWLHLQNTSIRFFSLTHGKGDRPVFLIKDVPFLREMIFHDVSVKEFNSDSFLGMPEMEILILHGTHLLGIPDMIGRMPKLKILEIVNGSNEFPELLDFTIPTEGLSTLKNLQVLNLKNNNIHSISGKLPPFSKLQILKLDGCKLSNIEESDFVGFSDLVELTLSENRLKYLKENTFRPLKRLKFLDLSFNKLTNWPVLYDFSFLLLDMSGNLLSDVYNLGNSRTTVEILNISYNRILEWDDKHVFSLQKSLISDHDQLNKLSASRFSEDSNKKNLSNSGPTKTNNFFKNNGLPTTQRAELNNPLHSGSQRKVFHRIPENFSLENFHNQTKLSKSDIGENIMKSNFWVTKINISGNLISAMSETMMQSLEGIHEVDLGGNEFNCVDCRMIPFQKWLNTTSTNVRNFGTSDPLLCFAPAGQRGIPVNVVQYDEEPCLEKIRTTSLLTLIGVPVGAMSTLLVGAAAVIYKFRAGIGYMLHLYKIRRRAMAFSQSVFNKYAFDAFVCYSSNDRRFVLTRLAPLLEKGKEQYCLCLHERDFPLGSHIVSNIVGSIQHSRKTIIVLSEHFVKSKWCQWELEMANHKMFNEDEHFLILIQLETLDRNSLPRHLQFLMDTRTYLEWPSPGEKDDEELKRLKIALGPSIFQTTNERAPLLSDVMEDY